jgi:hypothetical protein
MNSAMRFLPTSASILSRASIGRRTTVGFSCIGGRPMKIIPLKAISVIDVSDNICDIGYISKGRTTMFILYFDGQYHEYYHGTFERNGWRTYAEFRCNEGYWLVPGTDPEDFSEVVVCDDDVNEGDENDETLEYMVDLLDSGEIEPNEFSRQLLSVGYHPDDIAAAIEQVAA